MRYFEIAGGFRVPLSGEEQSVLTKVETSRKLGSNGMGEREGEVARQMARRGILTRIQDGSIDSYITNNDPPLTRL